MMEIIFKVNLIEIETSLIKIDLFLFLIKNKGPNYNIYYPKNEICHYIIKGINKILF